MHTGPLKDQADTGNDVTNRKGHRGWKEGKSRSILICSERNADVPAKVNELEDS